MAIKIEGTRTFQTKINKLRKKAKEVKSARVTVGFAMPYALFVHENIPGNAVYGKLAGGPKFLETASRMFGKALGEDIANGVKAGRPLIAVLEEAGQTLLNAAIDITPIETGALRASGFVSDVKTEEENARRAFERGQSIRVLRAARRALGHNLTPKTP